MTDTPAFKVSWSRESLADARAILEPARAAGRVEELIRALQIIDQRLFTDPLAFGEVYRSRGNVHFHTASCAFVGLDFSVCTKRKMVRVHTCRLLANRGVLSFHGEHPSTSMASTPPRRASAPTLHTSLIYPHPPKAAMLPW
jgi:hypothetical protein